MKASRFAFFAQAEHVSFGSRPTSCNEQRHSLLIQTVGVMKSFFTARSAARAVDDLAAG